MVHKVSIGTVVVVYEVELHVVSPRLIESVGHQRPTVVCGTVVKIPIPSGNEKFLCRSRSVAIELDLFSCTDLQWNRFYRAINGGHHVGFRPLTWLLANDLCCPVGIVGRVRSKLPGNASRSVGHVVHLAPDVHALQVKAGIHAVGRSICCVREPDIHDVPFSQGEEVEIKIDDRVGHHVGAKGHGEVRIGGRIIGGEPIVHEEKNRSRCRCRPEKSTPPGPAWCLRRGPTKDPVPCRAPRSYSVSIFPTLLLFGLSGEVARIEVLTTLRAVKLYHAAITHVVVGGQCGVGHPLKQVESGIKSGRIEVRLCAEGSCPLLRPKASPFEVGKPCGFGLVRREDPSPPSCGEMLQKLGRSRTAPSQRSTCTGAFTGV